MTKKDKKNKMMDVRAGKAKAAASGPLKKIMVFASNRAVKNVENGERAAVKIGSNCWRKTEES